MTTHLDDETISAALDGELRADEAARARAHLAECATCRARSAVFGDVAARVASVDAVAVPSDDVREAAVARALTAAGEPTAAALASRRNWAPVLAVAAVLALLLAAVPLIGALSSGGGDADTAAGSAGDDATTSLESGAGAAGGAAPDEALVDLGAVDGGNLAAVVGARLGSTTASMYAAPDGAPAAGADRERATATGRGAGDASAAPGPGGAVGDSGTGGASGGAEGDTLTADRARACESDVGARGDLALVARATWDDVPAAVLVYREGDDITAYVVDPASCSILQFVRFRAPS